MDEKHQRTANPWVLRTEPRPLERMRAVHMRAVHGVFTIYSEIMFAQFIGVLLCFQS